MSFLLDVKTKLATLILKEKEQNFNNKSDQIIGVSKLSNIAARELLLKNKKATNEIEAFTTIK